MGMHHSDMHQMDHPEPTLGDYLKFIAIINGIIALSLTIYVIKGDSTLESFLTTFMGVFFIVFALFKLKNLQDFMVSYFNYDLIARKWMKWGYFYPFIELVLGVGFLIGIAVKPLEWIALVLSVIGSIGVIKALTRKTKFKCACLGSFVNLPLSTVSLVEDLAMAVMAAYILTR